MGPASACLPRMIEEFTNSDADTQDLIAKVFASNILLKHVQYGTEKTCILENMLHFLSQNNFGDILSTFLSDNETKIVYVDSPYSPISKAKMHSFLPQMNYLKTLPLKEKFSVFSELDL
jgi:16S rRNA G966 N2-methylase RsmD